MHDEAKADEVIAAVNTAFKDMDEFDVRVAEVRFLTAAASDAAGKHAGWRPPDARVQLEVRPYGLASRMAMVDVFRGRNGNWQTPTTMKLGGHLRLIAPASFDL